MTTLAFDPASVLPALGGGVLIGAAAAVFVLLSGRIAGISGIVGGLWPVHRGDWGWRLAFVLGLMGAPLLLVTAGLAHAPRFDTSLGTLLIAGLLVGVGTRLAGGCTSGHGVCGVARLSPRSLLATGVFMALGMVATWALRHGGVA